jgi:hypothetical protein
MRVLRAAALLAGALLCLTRPLPPAPAAHPLPIAVDVDPGGAAVLSSASGRLSLGARALNGRRESPLSVERDGTGAWDVQWPWARERFEPSARGVELRWRFERAPEAQALSLSWQMSGEGFDFGRAVWSDSAGQHVTLALDAEAGSVRLEVPQEVLGRTVFPAELDPLIRVRPVDAPVIGPVGASLPMVTARTRLGDVAVVFHQRAIECHVFDDDGGLTAIHRLNVTAQGPWAAAGSGGQLLIAGADVTLRVSGDCGQLLDSAPAARQNATVTAVDGGWALLEDVATDAGIFATRYDVDGGVGQRASLGRPGSFFAAAASGPWLVVLQSADAPNATPLTATWYHPEDWSQGANASLVKSPNSGGGDVIAVPGQVLITWSFPLIARRFDADGVPLDAMDQSLGNAFRVFAAGPRYLLLGSGGDRFMDTALTMGPALPYYNCSSFQWGPRPLCDTSGQGPDQLVWLDPVTLAPLSSYVATQRMNGEAFPQLVAQQGVSWVTWQDDRESATRVFTAPLLPDGTLLAAAPVLDVADGLGVPWTAGPNGSAGLLVADEGHFTVTTAALDAGTVVVQPPRSNLYLSILTMWVGADTHTLFVYSWGIGGLSCPFATSVVRFTLDGGLIDTGGPVMVDCGGLGVSFTPGLFVDGGVLLANGYGVNLPDGGFAELGDIVFVPDQGPLVPVRTGAPMNIFSEQALVLTSDGFCFPTVSGLECDGFDGGISNISLPGPEHLAAWDGRRLHVVACTLDAGFAGVVLDDGGTQLADTGGVCGSIAALGPGHLAFVRQMTVDAGIDDVPRVFVSDYYELELGDACVAGTDCLSGYCVDGVCCDSACGFSAPDCQACGSGGHCGPAPCDGGVPPDAGAPPDAGTPADAGSPPDGGAPLLQRPLNVRCGCESSAPALTLLGLCALMRCRRLRSRCRRF